MIRLLLDPAAEPGQPAPAAPEPTPAPAAPPEVTHITMSAAEYRQLLDAQAEGRRLQDEARARAEKAEQDRIRAMAEKGQVDEAFARAREAHERTLAERDQSAAALAQRVHDRERRVALNDAFAAFQAATSLQVRPEAGPVLRDQWGKDFEVVDDPTRPDEFLVRERATLRPIADVIADRLKRPENAWYLLPSTKGGAPTPPPGSPPPPAAPPADPQSQLMSNLKAAIESARRGAIGLAGR